MTGCSFFGITLFVVEQRPGWQQDMSTIPAIVLNNGKTHADTEAFYAKKNGEWAPTTWTQYAALVRKAAAALLAHGYSS